MGLAGLKKQLLGGSVCSSPGRRKFVEVVKMVVVYSLIHNLLAAEQQITEQRKRLLPRAQLARPLDRDIKVDQLRAQ